MQLIPRIIKYRAWDQITNTMIESVYVFNQMVFDHNDHVIDNAVPMQFIGLPDKNGKEIYEYDIVKIKMFSGDERIGIIKYSSKWASFYLAIKNEHNIGIALDSVHQWYYSLDDDIIAEVIGNIFDNKELIPCD